MKRSYILLTVAFLLNNLTAQSASTPTKTPSPRPTIFKCQTFKLPASTATGLYYAPIRSLEFHGKNLVANFADGSIVSWHLQTKNCSIETLRSYSSDALHPWNIETVMPIVVADGPNKILRAITGNKPSSHNPHFITDPAIILLFNEANFLKLKSASKSTSNERKI